MAENRRNARAESSAPEQPALLPPVDVIEDASGITLYADLPGVPKDKLRVRIAGENLVIDGEIALEMAKNLEATHAALNSGVTDTPQGWSASKASSVRAFSLAPLSMVSRPFASGTGMPPASR